MYWELAVLHIETSTVTKPNKRSKFIGLINYEYKLTSKDYDNFNCDYNNNEFAKYKIIEQYLIKAIKLGYYLAVTTLIYIYTKCLQIQIKIEYDRSHYCSRLSNGCLGELKKSKYKAQSLQKEYENTKGYYLTTNIVIVLDYYSVTLKRGYGDINKIQSIIDNLSIYNLSIYNLSKNEMKHVIKKYYKNKLKNLLVKFIYAKNIFTDDFIIYKNYYYEGYLKTTDIATYIKNHYYEKYLKGNTGMTWDLEKSLSEF